ncbi:hypothetical protein NFI96_032124, partial [Prochilodus magdalenae]
WSLSWYHHWRSPVWSPGCHRRLCWSFYLDKESVWFHTCARKPQCTL